MCSPPHPPPKKIAVQFLFAPVQAVCETIQRKTQHDRPRYTPHCVCEYYSPVENYSYDNEPNLSRWPSSQSAVTCLPLFHDDLLSKIRTLRVGSFVHSRIIILNNASTRRCRRRCGESARQKRVLVCQAAQEGRQVRLNGASTGR